MFRYQKFFEAQNSAPTKFFGTVRKTFQAENRDTSSLFRYQKHYETQKVPCKESNQWDKNFQRKVLIPLLCLANRNFLKHETVPVQSFSTLRDKNFSKETVDAP